jgi:hypothetical protein
MAAEGMPYDANIPRLEAAGVVLGKAIIQGVWDHYAKDDL